MQTSRGLPRQPLEHVRDFQGREGMEIRRKNKGPNNQIQKSNNNNNKRNENEREKKILRGTKVMWLGDNFCCPRNQIGHVRGSATNIIKEWMELHSGVVCFELFFPSLWGGIKFGLESSNWKWVKWTGKLGARKNFV